MTDPDHDLAEVVRRELRLLDPALRASPRLVDALLHPDLVEVGASGRRWNRASIIAALAADPEVSGAVSDLAPVALAAGVVLLTYRVGAPHGSLRCSVWVRDPAQGWLLRYHQGTAAQGC